MNFTNNVSIATHSLSSARLCWICSVVRRLISAVLRLNTCFPIQLLPTNFFEILIGSQLSNFDKNVRSVVPSVKGKRPALNSIMRRFAYASSSGVHFPLRKGGPFFFPPDPPDPEDERGAGGAG